MDRARSAGAALAFAVLIMASAASSWAGSKHVATGGKDCAECHARQEKVWFESKHGLMGVKCVICHGSTEQGFVTSPDIYRCRGCHAEQVADAVDLLGEKKASCALCHDPHAVTVSFHSKGGK
jgi:hypothetical protein